MPINLNSIAEDERAQSAPDHASRLRTAQVRLLYQHTPTGLIGSIVNLCILVPVFWDVVSKPILVGWAVACGSTALGRFILCHAYRASAKPEQTQLWQHRSIAGAALAGTLWGWAGFAFFIPESLLHQMLLAFVLAGMASGAIATLSSIRNAYLAFLVPALLPFIARLLQVGDREHMAMAAMFVLYIALLNLISRRLSATVTESLRLRFDNLDLLQDLTQAEDCQKRLNQKLAAHIVEKHRAQEELLQAYADLELRIQERTEKLARSEQALREANQYKDRFLGMVGHELRNPLQAIVTAGEVLQQNAGQAGGVIHRISQIIGNQSLHLKRLLDDLLDVARVNQGRIELKKTLIDLVAAVQQGIETQKNLIEERRHELTATCPPEPVRIKADATRCVQIVGNLLQNAAKFTEPGGELEVFVECDGGSAVIRIRDNGIGIAAEDIPRIFDPFVQERRSLEHSCGGLGIGLALVKQLVELQGGRIEVSSPGAGLGSEFLIRFPVAEENIAEASVEDRPATIS